MDSNHKVPVVRITEILKHPNADKLEIIPIGGYQVVVGKGQFNVGDLAVYIQPDSIVPETPVFAWLWEKDGGGNPRPPFTGPVPEKYRRVTVKKLRKEWSEGLLMPLAELNLIAAQTFTGGGNYVNEGDDVAELIGVTHYNPPEFEEELRGPSVKQSKVWPRSLKGWYYFLTYWLSFGLYNPRGHTDGQGNEKAPENTPPIYDVETYKNHTSAFEATDYVIVTEKIHGSNARYTYRPTKTYVDLFGFLKSTGKMYAGSRKLWKASISSSIWRKILTLVPDIERWCHDNPGFTLYGEVTPTQAGFDYGSTKDKPRFFLFDILDPDGKWVNPHEAIDMTSGYDIEWVPFLQEGLFDYEKILKSVDRESKVSGANHIREGIVIKTATDKHVRGLGRAQLKIVSNNFLEKDGK